MTESKLRTKRWAPLAGIAAAAVAGGAAVEFATAPLSQAFAQEQRAPIESRGPSFADVVERASPAVVNISVTKVNPAMPTSAFPGDRVPRGLPGSPLDEFFGRFFEMPDVPNLPRGPRRSEGAGSGFVVDADGHIVTNYHVVSDAEEIVVTLQDGTRLDAAVVGEDSQTDLALLKVEAGDPLPFVAFGDSSDARVGDWVLAIGNPFGLGGTATAGIISARGRDIRSGPYDDYLQIDAPINSGNSGGPVFNLDGEVIGVNTAIFSPNGGNIGIGFAIPANQAATIVAQLKAGGAVERGWLGVHIQDLDPDLAETLGLDAETGALVAEVVAGSPAAGAGLEPGDVVTRFGDRDIASVRDLSLAVAARAPGESVTVRIVRDGEPRELEVELGEVSGSRPVAARPGGRADSGNAALGLRLAPLTDQQRERLGLPADVGGVLVADVQPDSEAAAKGVRPGDVIVEVDRRPVDSVDAAAGALRDARRDGSNALVLLRRGQEQRFVALDFS